MKLEMVRRARDLSDEIYRLSDFADLVWAHGFVTALKDRLEEKLRAHGVTDMAAVADEGFPPLER